MSEPQRLDNWQHGDEHSEGLADGAASGESGHQTPATETSAAQTPSTNTQHLDPHPNTQQSASGPRSGGMSTIERSILESEVIEQLRTVYDPEIPVNIYDLGLIYDIQIDDAKNVHIVMTLTSPMCPVAGSLPGEVEQAARNTPGIGNVSVELTWDPPFGIERMSEEVKLMLGLM